jgi:hypothetical protein
MMLILALVLALIPLLGIAYTLISGGGLTVDNLFLVLILLTISGVFLLSAVLDAKARGYLKLGKKQPDAKPAAAGQKQAAKTS